MKSKASLLLMEQLVMILIFAVAAALCLQIFAGAQNLSRETKVQDEAVILAQNAAELLKATGGDIQAAQDLGQSPYSVEIVPQESSVSGLKQVQIQIFAEETLVFSLETAWQEVTP